MLESPTPESTASSPHARAVLLLEEATQKGSVKWVPEEGETDSFSTSFESGAVRISRIIVGSIKGTRPR